MEGEKIFETRKDRASGLFARRAAMQFFDNLRQVSPIPTLLCIPEFCAQSSSGPLHLPDSLRRLPSSCGSLLALNLSRGSGSLSGTHLRDNRQRKEMSSNAKAQIHDSAIPNYRFAFYEIDLDVTMVKINIVKSSDCFVNGFLDREE